LGGGGGSVGCNAEEGAGGVKKSGEKWRNVKKLVSGKKNWAETEFVSFFRVWPLLANLFQNLTNFPLECHIDS
jgi:hypothetical protein